jgi:hypothetical protein
VVTVTNPVPPEAANDATAGLSAKVQNPEPYVVNENTADGVVAVLLVATTCQK